MGAGGKIASASCRTCSLSPSVTNLYAYVDFAQMFQQKLAEDQAASKVKVS
jgi:hypothetical protein